MATLYAYPLGTPKNNDLIVGTSVPLPNTNKDEQPRTVNFTVSSILALVSGSGGFQNLQQVTNLGQVGGISISTNNVKFSGQFIDSTGAIGTNGQILTSDASGKTVWGAAGGSGTVTSVASTFAGDAVAIGGSPITAAGTLAYSWSGDATHYINGAGNKVLLSSLPQGVVTSLTTTGTSGASTLTSGVLNIPNYATSGGAVTSIVAGTNVTISGSTGDVTVNATVPITSLTTTGTSGASTLTSGVLNIPSYTSGGGGVVTSLTTSGYEGAATLNSGVLNIPNYDAITGADTYVQYNDSGSFGSGSFFTTNKTSKVDVKYEVGLLGDGTNQGILKIYCEDVTTPHYVGIKGPLHSGGASYTLQLPNTLPSVANQILESNASGDLSWIATPSGGGGITGSGGANQITYWDSGSTVAGESDFVYEIDSGNVGHVGINVSDPNSYWTGHNSLVIAGDPSTGYAGITLVSTAASPSGINFSEGKTSADLKASIGYVHSSGSTYGLRFRVDSAQQMELFKDGSLGLNTYGSGTVTGTATYNLSVDSTGKVIETANPSTSLLKTAKNSWPDSDIKVGGTFTFTMPNVPVGKQLLMQNVLFYLDYGGTPFNAPTGYTAFLSFNDGNGSTTIQIPAAQSFFNSTKDTMQVASSISYPSTIGDVVITGGGTMDLILPAGADSPNTGNGELYISIEYKEITTGSGFTL